MADTTTDTNLAVDAEALRAEVSKKYSEVAVEPDTHPGPGEQPLRFQP